jgi:stage V sporulation protein SpoVS
MEVSCVPSFIDVQIDGNERTGISLRIERRLQGDDPR